MLVVIMILLILAGVAVPVMRPALEGRRVREAARAVNVYFSSARNRALETGRPSGVMLQRMEVEPGASMILHQVEVPPPYAGDTADARFQVQHYASNTFYAQMQAAATFTPKLVSVGDLIQFNGQGPWYQITGPDDNTDDVIDDDAATATDPLLMQPTQVSAGQMTPWPTPTDTPAWSQPVPYQILRRPTKSAAAPLQLPMRTVVDLAASGIHPGETTPTAAAPGTSLLGAGPVSILFSGNGSLDRIDAKQGDGAAHPLAGPLVFPVYLLVGRRDKVGDAANPNWADFNNIWVALNPQTGMVTTAPVASTTSVDDSRELARKAYSVGGR